MKFRFPIVIIDEDFRSENTSGLGIRALAQAIESEGFEVVGVTAWARTVNGATVQVQVNEANLLSSALTPSTTTAAPNMGTLPATRTARRGSAGQTIGIVGISGGTSPVDLSVSVLVRPYPMGGEASQSAT